MKKIKTINQYTPSVAFGDSISNAVIYVQKILISLGFESKIYIGINSIGIDFKHEVFHIEEYKDSESNLLIYHHSIGHIYHDYILNLLDKKIMIYHNITPEHFFPKNSLLYDACLQGREQLKSNPEEFIASIGDSEYNCKELIINNYKNVLELPLLIDFERTNTPNFNQEIINKYLNTFNILFVGRIVLNKCQHQLINVISYLKRNYQNRDFKLIIVGEASQPEYQNYIKSYAKKLDLEKDVIFTGKVSNDDLATYYKVSNLYLSLSVHEGFGMPLIEALKYDIPVLAYNAGGISSTVIKDSLMENKSTSYISKRIIQIVDDSLLRAKIVLQQQNLLNNFSNKNIRNKFIDFLYTLGINKLSFKENIKIEDKLNIKVEGPFDSTYSLAIVNKNLANVLSQKHNLSLHSTEGYGDFKPEIENLDDKTLQIYKNKFEHIDITIRNLYPPRTNIMQGHCKILGPYGWEESSFSKNYINQFNRNLSYLACMSNYVKKVMIANGLQIPAVVTHIGVDHILKDGKEKLKNYNIPKDKFILLHISSCFPRKGADILVELFADLTKEYDDIYLIIKTFNNPHNNISEQISSLNDEVKNKILLISEDLPQSEINYLYSIANALIAPSFGEGFGLPLAEAMLFETPVVTTAYSGQLDFCNEENSWLVDYDFEPSKSHMNLFNSYWANPKKESIKAQILDIYNSDDKKINKKTQKAKQNILQNFTWNKVSQNLIESYKNFINDTDKKQIQDMNIAWISTFNSKCGIASYSKSLIDSIKSTTNHKIKIFANTLEENKLILKDSEIKYSVTRNWKDRFDKDNMVLTNDLKNDNFTHIVIQFNFSFFNLENLKQIIENNQDKNITIELHSVEDVKEKGIESSLSWIIDTLKRVNIIIVHNIQDLNTLKNFGLVKNIFLLPLGVNIYQSNETRKQNLQKKYKLESKKLIATYGFLLPHKGILEIIEAFKIVKKQDKNLHLLLLNSIYPSPISEDYKKECLKKVEELNLQNDISFINDYLDYEDSFELLNLSDLLVLMYKNTQESASASIRELLTTKKPVLCSKEKIFNDVSQIVHFIDEYTVPNIAKNLELLLNSQELLQSKANIQKEWIKEHSWENISKIFVNILKNY